MPGHIFSQTGKWSEAVKYFELAKAKEIEYMTADPTYGTGHHGHNTNYLSTAYSFGGDYEKAVHTATRLLEYKESKQESATLDTFYSAYRQAQFALIRALVQHEKWDEILEGKTIPEIAKPRPQAWLAWARGIAYAAKGKHAEARAELEKMDRQVEDVMKMTWDREARELNAGRIELRGHIEIAEGQADRGFATLRLASEREQRLRYSEPPWYPRPVAEALGWQALRHGRPALAREAFHTALKQYQNDARALEGLKALEQAR
jgi:Flp pilus assembly protein TadD